MTGRASARSSVVKWLQDTPRLRTSEIAALAGVDTKYMAERIRVMELDGYVVRDTPMQIGRYTYATWKAADPQPQPKRRSYAGKARKAKRCRQVGRTALPSAGQIVVLRPAPPRDVVVVGQALAQLPDLHAAWMGRAI